MGFLVFHLGGWDTYGRVDARVAGENRARGCLRPQLWLLRKVDVFSMITRQFLLNCWFRLEIAKCYVRGFRRKNEGSFCRGCLAEENEDDAEHITCTSFLERWYLRG